jgi:hypothetical protein
MNERIDAIYQQVIDEACADPLYRFAELVRQDEREAVKRPWIGLTDEEIHKIIDDCTPDEAELEELNDFAKAIFAVEAKLKERNT